MGNVVGRSQQEIYRWEKGLVRVHVEDLGKLAVVLGVDVKAFYDETGMFWRACGLGITGRHESHDSQATAEIHRLSQHQV